MGHKEARTLYSADTTAALGESTLGLPPGVVQICNYSPTWSAVFSVEATRLATRLESVSPAIAHIGSTSVPGLMAKPIIDILMGSRQPEDRPLLDAELQRMGYISHGEKGVPGRLFFSAGNPAKFHLHLVDFDGSIWEGHILFRECLRKDKALARQYEAIKRYLATQFPRDRDSYTRGKANFIEKTLAGVRKLS